MVDYSNEEQRDLIDPLIMENKIKILELKVNKSEENINELEQALKNNTSIKFLNIVGLNFYMLEILINVLINNTSLGILILSDLIGDNETIDLILELYSRLIRENKTLTKLTINNGGIDNEGITTILGPALSKNTTLKTLDISGNNIGYNGIIALKEALLNNTTLTSLYIYGIEKEFSIEDTMYEINNNSIDKGKKALAELQIIIDRNRDTLLDTELSLNYNDENFIEKHLKNLQLQYPDFDDISIFLNDHFKKKFIAGQICINKHKQIINAMSKRELGTFREIIKTEYFPIGLVYHTKQTNDINEVFNHSSN